MARALHTQEARLTLQIAPISMNCCMLKTPPGPRQLLRFIVEFGMFCEFRRPSSFSYLLIFGMVEAVEPNGFTYFYCWLVYCICPGWKSKRKLFVSSLPTLLPGC